jgi:2-succinyl-6-hydroxy-2,4-cyclohexadiene-1-carboxylate synthase
VIAGRQPGVGHPPQGVGGPPLVLLHGFLGSPASWDPVLAGLPHRGPAWCPWLPGHGPAEPAPTDFAAAAQAIADSLPAGAVLAGYSLGARLALAATLRRPGLARSTLLISGHVGLADRAERAARAELDARRAAALRGGDLAAFVSAWETLPLFESQRALPATMQVEQRAARLANDPQALAWAFEVAGLAQMPDLHAAVAAARQRLCFLTGALDARFGAVAASVVSAPWVTHSIVPGAGHNLLLEAPDAVAASLTSLMRSE